MRLLFTITAYPPSIGGAQLHLHYLARHLLRHGHRIQVATHWDEQRLDWLLGTTLRGPSTALDYIIDDVPVRRLALGGDARRRLRIWVYAYYALQRWSLPRIATAIAGEIEPLIAGAELVHNCRVGREGLSYASLYLARQHGLPFVLTPFHHPRWGSWLHRYYQRLYRAADAVVTLTEAEKEMVAAFGVERDRIFVTGHGPVLSDSASGQGFRTRHGLHDEPVILFLGQKYRYKGVGILLQAAKRVWSRFPEARFVFVGPRTGYSRKLFASVLDSRVIELGTVGLQEKTDALAACDVLCLPSTQESFGGVFTEAWSLGKPVMGADIAAVRDVVDHQVNGIIAPVDSEVWAEQIVALIEDPARAARLGSSGRDKTRERYTWDRIATTTESVYRSVVDRYRHEKGCRRQSQKAECLP